MSGAIKGLRGARIGVIAPSGAQLDPAGFERALAWLEARGAVLSPWVSGEPFQRFAAPDEQRLAGIHQAAARDDLDVVMITRGGYGVSRLLDRIDWPLIERSVKRGCRWVGYSDFTAFQLALLAQSGQPSFTGPTVNADFAEGRPDPFTLAQFETLLDGHVPEVSWSDTTPSDVEIPELQGVLWGGNLAMIASLVGTPYLPQIDGGLLFLEDVSEHPYRIERLLHQLFYAGVLQRQQAIILGAFSDWKPAPHDGGYDLTAVVQYWRNRLSTPILGGLPFGHIPARAVLGIGLVYRLSRQANQVRLKPIKQAWPTR